MQNLVKFVHLKKILSYQSKVNTKNVMYILRKIYVFLETDCKRLHPKNPF
jgi:predicted nucleotidyltransferase